LVSMTWIEEGRAYAFQQLINPGPTELVPLDQTEEGLRQLVKKALEVQRALSKAAAEPSTAKRAEAVLPFVDEETYGCSSAAFKILAGCGKDVLPVLRPLLNDERRLPVHPKVIEIMTQAAGKAAQPDLERVLAEELVYWKKVGPTLGKWWGQEPMSSHYCLLHAVLIQLKKIDYTDERKMVAALRDYWRSLPPPDYIPKSVDADGKYVGRSQMVEAAEAIIGK